MRELMEGLFFGLLILDFGFSMYRTDLDATYFLRICGHILFL